MLANLVWTCRLVCDALGTFALHLPNALREGPGISERYCNSPNGGTIGSDFSASLLGFDQGYESEGEDSLSRCCWTTTEGNRVIDRNELQYSAGGTRFH